MKDFLPGPRIVMAKYKCRELSRGIWFELWHAVTSDSDAGDGASFGG
jgi:hypothetical protein